MQPFFQDLPLLVSGELTRCFCQCFLANHGGFFYANPPWAGFLLEIFGKKIAFFPNLGNESGREVQGQKRKKAQAKAAWAAKRVELRA